MNKSQSSLGQAAKFATIGIFIMPVLLSFYYEMTMGADSLGNHWGSLLVIVFLIKWIWVIALLAVLLIFKRVYRKKNNVGALRVVDWLIVTLLVVGLIVMAVWGNK